MNVKARRMDEEEVIIDIFNSLSAHLQGKTQT
jgi:hypothetical protein